MLKVNSCQSNKITDSLIEATPICPLLTLWPRRQARVRQFVKSHSESSSKWLCSLTNYGIKRSVLVWWSLIGNSSTKIAFWLGNHSNSGLNGLISRWHARCSMRNTTQSQGKEIDTRHPLTTKRQTPSPKRRAKPLVVLSVQCAQARKACHPKRQNRREILSRPNAP